MPSAIRCCCLFSCCSSINTKYNIIFTESFVRDVFSKSIELNNINGSNFYFNIRFAFKYELIKLLEASGLKVVKFTVGQKKKLTECKKVELNPVAVGNSKIDIDFCARYGHDDSSLHAINYAYSNLKKLPSLLPFIAIENFSIGNICLYIKVGDGNSDLEISDNQIVKMAGYSTNISSGQKKFYLCLWGIYFDFNFLSLLLSKYIIECTCRNLDEYFQPIYGYPVIFICKLCGQLYVCECFKNYINRDSILGTNQYYDDRDYVNCFKKIKFKNNICHLCTKSIPIYDYASTLYFSYFLARYYPYYLLLLKKKNIVYNLDSNVKDVESELRSMLEFPSIGSSGVSEKILYKGICYLFSNFKVINRYRGKELRGLELDIFIPELKLAIEYQGQQHYEAFPHLGGDIGLEKRILNDDKKKDLCKILNYKLVKIDYGEDLSIPSLFYKFKNYLIVA